MRTKTVSMRLLLCALVCVAPIGAAQTKEAARRPATALEMKAFTRLYAQGDLAFANKDRRFFQTRTAPQFVRKSLDGHVDNRAAYLKGLSKMFSEVRVSEVKTIIKNVGMQRATASVAEENYLAGTISDAQKRTHRILIRGNAVKTWILTGAGWQMSAAQETASHLFIDGKEISRR